MVKYCREHPCSRPRRHCGSNCYGPLAKLKVMVGVVEMTRKVKVEGGVMKMNVMKMNVMGMVVRVNANVLGG